MVVRRNSMIAALVLGLGLVAAGTNNAAAQERLPNLLAFPASNLVVVDDDAGEPELRFSTTSWNAGAGPLEIYPGTPDANNNQIVYQRIYLNGGGSNSYAAGSFEFHGDHGHFHFEEFALYTLRPAGGGNEGLSFKTSFCLMDTGKVNGRLPGAPRRAVYTSCFNDVQGISVGWGDTYGSHLVGQSISLAGLPAGRYELEIAYDPFNRLIESSDADNVACSLLDIDPAGGTVQAVGACGATEPAPVTIASITPSSLRAGSATSVVITGANFTPGINVSFEGGAGQVPTLSNVQVLDAGTISATVSVKNGGDRSDPVWDLRVGTAVLANAFTVTR